MINPLSALAVFTFLLSCPVLAAEQTASKLEQEVDFNISPQLLDTALVEFARQANVQLMFAASDFGGRQTRGLRGKMVVSSALTELLRDSGLVYQAMGENTITVKPGKLDSAWDALQSADLQLVQSNTQGAMTQQAERLSDKDAADHRESALQEIVVTAQKREERLQDVPISISVLSGDDLDKSTVEGVTEALNRVPGVATTVTLQGANTQIAIRGVTAGAPNFSGSSPIAYYLDSAPFGLVKTAIAPDANAYDLARIEVARGPQGTLYGASAQNGVVRVLTKDADLGELEFKARTSASSTDRGGENYRGDAAINVPILPGKLAARAVVGYQDFAGWIDKPIKKDANDSQISNMRLKVNAQPREELSIGLLAWRSRADLGAPSVSADGELRPSLLDESISTDYDVYGLKLGYEFRRFSLLSMTSYLDYANAGNLDISAFGLPAPQLFTAFDAEMFSQEFVLNSNADSPLRWSAGAFYRDGEDRLRQNSAVGGTPSDFADGSESYAVFGEIGRRLLDQKLEWTLGLRYFRDEVFSKENISQGVPGEPLIYNAASFDSTTPRAVLTWYPSNDAMVYGSYSEGFRSGFPQATYVLRNFPTFPPVEPDKLQNYEIGAKADVADGRISLDLALYYAKWRDVQQTLVVGFEGNAVSAVINGQSASGVGVDFAATTLLLEQLEIGLNFSWNDLTMDEKVLSGGFLLFDKGDRLNLSPEYTVGASADYVFPMGSGGFEGQLSASANYTSAQDNRLLAGPNLFIGHGDPMLIARTSISIHAPKGWTATLFADNMNNERGAPAVSVLVPEWNLHVRPRTIGLQLEYQFGR